LIIRRRASIPIGIAAAIGGACYQPSYDDPTCGDHSECPSGWECTAGPGSACVRVGDAGSADADPIDAAPSPCDLDAPFQDLHKVPGINSAAEDFGPTLSADERTIYFVRYSPADPTGLSSLDLYVATRPSRDEPFGAAVPLDALNTIYEDSDPSLSPDELSLYFASNRDGAPDIFVARRAHRDDAFGPAESVGSVVNSADGIEIEPYAVDDALYFMRDNHLFRTEGSQSARPVSGLSADQFWSITPSRDELTMFLGSPRNGISDIWVARRTGRDQAFEAPQYVGELSTNDGEFPDWISPDGCRLYFGVSTGDHTADIWVATRPLAGLR